VKIALGVVSALLIVVIGFFAWFLRGIAQGFDQAFGYNVKYKRSR